MSDVVALAETLSDTLVVDPSTQPEDSTPPAFELNRLPPELRENVIVEAALAASLGERKRIMLVNHEFKEAAIPHARCRVQTWCMTTQFEYLRREPGQSNTSSKFGSLSPFDHHLDTTAASPHSVRDASL
jgi:hypothetical protein